MILRYRRPGLLVACVLALLAALLAPAGALAAVANETALTVRFVDSVTLLPVDGAAVRVTAHQDGAAIGEFDGTTDATGLAVLAHLPHETGDGGAVTLDVVAHKESSFADAETGCVLDNTWDASRLGVAVDDVALAVDFTAGEQQAVSSIQCPPDQAPPTGEVGGAVGTPGAIGTPGATLPPTDSVARSDAATPGSVAVIAALAGLSAGLLVLLPRRRRAAVRVERRGRR